MNEILITPTLLFIIVIGSSSVFAQDRIFELKLNKEKYAVGDTIKVDYYLDSLEVLHSNFGGCGGGPVYFVTVTPMSYGRWYQIQLVICYWKNIHIQAKQIFMLSLIILDCIQFLYM